MMESKVPSNPRFGPIARFSNIQVPELGIVFAVPFLEKQVPQIQMVSVKSIPRREVQFLNLLIQNVVRHIQIVIEVSP